MDMRKGFQGLSDLARKKHDVFEGERLREQAQQAEKQAEQIAALQKMVFGKTSEKLPSPGGCPSAC